MKIRGHKDTQNLFELENYLYNTICQDKEINYLLFLPHFSQEFVEERYTEMKQHIFILKELQKIPFIKQRSQEWLDARKSRLTASDLEDAIKENNIRMAKKKAGIIKDNINYNEIPALKWGTMFEPMASRCYSQDRMNIPIHEFGLLFDKNLEVFGASPDGINSMGIMIEIKCPFSREIVDEHIPSKYYMQIQGQLAVCDLKYCDYIECEFKVFDTTYLYFTEMENFTINHGVIAEYYNENTKEYEYIYSKPFLTPENAYEDIKEEIMQNKCRSELKLRRVHCWKLNKMNIQRVSFNQSLWNDTIPKIQKFWEKVESCRNLPVEEPKLKPKILFIPDDD